MRRAIATVALTVLALVSHAQVPTVKLGYLPLNSHTAFYAAERGLFKKHGAHVEVALFQNGPLLVKALLAGDLVAGDIATTVMINLASQGLPLYFLTADGYQTPKHPAGAIMIRPDDSSIKSFRDLKGKSVAQLAIGTLTYMRLFSAANKYGMKRDDFREVNAPFGQMGTLLATRQVDAAYTWPPFDTLMVKAGQGKVLVNDTDWAPVAMASGLVVRKEWADKNPDAVRALVKAWIEAGRWVNDNGGEARMVAAKYLKLPPDVAKDMRMLYWPRNGYQLMPSIWDHYHLMVKTGQIKAASNPAAMIEHYWIKPAQTWITPALKDIGTQADPVTAEMLGVALPNLEGDPKKYRGPWER